jgi:hypothetical protein
MQKLNKCAFLTTASYAIRVPEWDPSYAIRVPELLYSDRSKASPSLFGAWKKLSKIEFI